MDATAVVWTSSDFMGFVKSCSMVPNSENMENYFMKNMQLFVFFDLKYFFYDFSNIK